MPNKFEKLADGHYLAEGELGEHFTGSADEIIPTILDAQQNTKKAYQQEKAARATAEQRAAQLEQELAASKQQQAQNNQQAAPYDERQLVEYGKFSEEARARVRGFKSKEDLWEYEQGVVSKVESYNDRLMAEKFHAEHPDFPDTPHAVEALGKAIDEFASGKWNEKTMAAAHALLVHENSQDSTKGYAPLTQEQIEAARGNVKQVNRQAPPPMLRTNNPELSSTQGNDPWTMDMLELRKAAIKQQLDKP